MDTKSNHKNGNLIETDDIAFSAYLKMKGHKLIQSDQKRSKSIFIFENDHEDADALKIEFVNSEYLCFYNELRNLKKLL